MSETATEEPSASSFCVAHLTHRMRNALSESSMIDGAIRIPDDTSGNTVRGMLQRGLIDKTWRVTDKGRDALKADNRIRGL